MGNLNGPGKDVEAVTRNVAENSPGPDALWPPMVNSTEHFTKN